MPTYEYTARDQQGNPARGTVEATSNSVAAAHLRAQGLWVTGLRAVGQSRETARTAPGEATMTLGAEASPRGSLLDAWWTGVSLKELAIFFRQFGTMVNAGMPLYRSLTILGSQTSNRRLQQVIGDLAAQVQAGGKLSEAFRRHPALFRPVQIAMIEAAEAGGLLDRMLNRIADYLEREYEIRLEIKRRTLYPKLLLAAAVFIPPIHLLIFNGVVPYLQATVGRIALLVVLVAALWLLFRLLFQIPAFRALYDAIKLAIPGLGKVVRQFAVGKFTRSLAALYGAGLPVTRALRVSADACDNYLIARAVHRQSPRVERGEPMSAVLAGTGLFSPIVLGMVATGEHAGDMEGMLNKVADYQEREAEHSTRQLVVVLGVVVYLAVALLVASQIVSFYGGYARGISAG
jgi:type IV pilus assembly protein PilC